MSIVRPWIRISYFNEKLGEAILWLPNDQTNHLKRERTDFDPPPNSEVNIKHFRVNHIFQINKFPY